MPAIARSVRRHALSLVAGLLLAGQTHAAEPAHYRLDPVHTRVLFAIEHAGFSHALGTVSGSTGTLDFDPGDWTTARLHASVPLTRADLGDAAWNRAAMAGNLLDVARFPVAEFVSTAVEPLAPDRARVRGMLTLHGIAREVVLEVTLNALKRHPLPPFRRTVGFSATATLSRKAFGIDAWPSVIGDAVELRIEAEAVRARGDGRDDDATGSPEATSPPADVPDTTPVEAPPASPRPDTDPPP
jgi:polyisoprenoid-binding protein YceI